VNEALRTSDPEPQFLALPHGPLAYADEGPRDAPIHVAVHGIPGSLRDFRYLAPQLCDGVRLLRLDMPGFGASAPLDEAIDSVPGRARVILEAADRLGLAEFAVLGHSILGSPKSWRDGSRARACCPSRPGDTTSRRPEPWSWRSRSNGKWASDNRTEAQSPSPDQCL
jgi:hypothetical protein